MSANTPLRLSPEAVRTLRVEIRRAGGREVCFLARVTPQRIVVEARAVARGNREAVLAASKDEPEGGVMIHNHPSGLLEPSDADLGVAARLFDRGIGTAIVDNEVTRIYVVVEPPRPRVVEPLDLDELEETLSPSGPLAALHPGYEDRASQRGMLRMVGRRYNEGGLALVEAGTGTGKSLAYLLPAAAWALKNRERTVISTATVNLQEQLVGKDLPLVSRLLGSDVRWALVKGRGNYVSIRRARLAASSARSLFDSDDNNELDALITWMESTEDGSLGDLPFVPAAETWDEVRSDSDICLRARCPHFQQCFYQQSRRKAASADLLVANHHLLFADLSVRISTGNFVDGAVLPPYRHLILDEAHNVEDAATAHLGAEASRLGLYRILARLDRSGKGVLSAIHDRLGGEPERGAAKEIRQRIEERVRPVLSDARSALSLFIETMEPLAPPGGEPRRLGSAEGSEPILQAAVRERYDGLMSTFVDLERQVSELRTRIESDSAWADDLDGRTLDLRSAERQLEAARRAVRMVLNPTSDGPDFVRWMEVRSPRRKGGGNLAFAAAPVSVGDLIREAMFDKVDSAVLTSATLTTRGRFDFVRDRLGLGPKVLAADEEAPEVMESIFNSPFDFYTQSMFSVPTDLPDAAGSGAELNEETARALAEFAALTDGGLFALFTSHSAVRRVAQILDSRGLPWPLFVHGRAPRALLLERFTEAGNGILLGTASFWEGVDVPGRPLRGLVIQKLPFRVPTEPVTEARVEAVERGGGNAFWDFMLPHAALRLKQGFGRLIRSRADRGAIVLLDDRILRKRYGRYLRDSLPESPLVKGPWHEVLWRLEEFYRNDPTLSDGPEPVRLGAVESSSPSEPIV